MPDEYAYQAEFYEIMEHNRVHEGNWGAWLGGKGKLNSFTWIGNKNSGNKIRNKFNAEVVPISIKRLTDDNFKNGTERIASVAKDLNFDFAKICSSFPCFT